MSTGHLQCCMPDSTLCLLCFAQAAGNCVVLPGCVLYALLCRVASSVAWRGTAWRGMASPGLGPEISKKKAGLAVELTLLKLG